MGNVQISFMEKSDIQESANVLSVAMLDNPLHVAVFQGKGEKERMEIEKMFCELLIELPGIVFLARKVADVPKDAIDDNDIGWRKSLWHTEWGRHDPIEQHWHLGPIGVLPGHQGSGIGTMLMERFCREVDACAAKAYLETDGDKNVRFYEKFGFEVVRESEIFDVKNRYMLRASKASFDTHDVQN
jgi:GNAT superfamily N-acetyltransferase